MKAIDELKFRVSTDIEQHESSYVSVKEIKNQFNISDLTPEGLLENEIEKIVMRICHDLEICCFISMGEGFIEFRKDIELQLTPVKKREAFH